MEREVLTKVLVEVLGVDASEIHEDTTFVKDLGADSLDVFQIVCRLQEELNVTFDPAKVETIENVEQALLLIKQTMIQELSGGPKGPLLGCVVIRYEWL